MKVYYPSKTTGSAKKLEGDVYVITLFVSETLWPINKKMELFKFVRDAESWLEGKAKEVMHNHYFPLTGLEISFLTTWLVGLSEKEESWFETFLPY